MSCVFCGHPAWTYCVYIEIAPFFPLFFAASVSSAESFRHRHVSQVLPYPLADFSLEPNIPKRNMSPDLVLLLSTHPQDHGSPMFPLGVYHIASPSIWPAVQSLQRGRSTYPWVTMWCVCAYVSDLLCRCIVRLLDGSMMVLHLSGSTFLTSDGF